MGNLAKKIRTLEVGDYISQPRIRISSEVMRYKQKTSIIFFMSWNQRKQKPKFTERKKINLIKHECCQCIYKRSKFRYFFHSNPRLLDHAFTNYKLTSLSSIQPISRSLWHFHKSQQHSSLLNSSCHNIWKLISKATSSCFPSSVQ